MKKVMKAYAVIEEDTNTGTQVIEVVKTKKEAEACAHGCFVSELQIWDSAYLKVDEENLEIYDQDDDHSKSWYVQETKLFI